MLAAKIQRDEYKLKYNDLERELEDYRAQGVRPMGRVQRAIQKQKEANAAAAIASGGNEVDNKEN